MIVFLIVGGVMSYADFYLLLTSYISCQLVLKVT